MRWFRGRKAEVIKQKLRIRKAPKSAPGQKPVYKSPAVRQRGPKLRKPIVKRPLVPAFSAIKVDAHAQDVSIDELQILESGVDGPISQIVWRSNGMCSARENARVQQCPADGTSWGSLDEFLGGRAYSAAPTTGKPLGLYGYSHPDCGCRLEVTVGERTVDVGPYA